MNRPSVSCLIEDTWVVGVDPGKPEACLLRDREKPFRYLSHREAERLLGDPAAAATRAEQVLAHKAQDPLAQLLMGAVRLRAGNRAAARTILESLAQSQPQLGSAWRELGFARAAMGERADAVEALARAIDLNFRDEDAWYALGDLLSFAESSEPEAGSSVVAAREHFQQGRLDAAETTLRKLLAVQPECAPALKLMADVAICAGRWRDVFPLLERALQSAPDFGAARFRCATMLFTHRQFAAALPHIDALLEVEPANTLYRALKAMALSADRRLDAALPEFERLVQECPDRPGLWFQYALLLRALRSGKAHAAFRRAIEICPSFVDAYVSLAHVKTICLDEAFAGQVEAQLARADLAAEDRARLHFVLGKTFEDMGRYAPSFAHYRASNDILREGRDYGAEVSTNFMRHSKRFFTSTFFRARTGCGHPAPDPIFIVGMPRSGSTLVEQILASHSAIEGLGELPHLQHMVEEMEAAGEHYPDALKNFGPDRFRALGEKYLALARSRRKSSKPFFTDKFPGNFSYTGLIGLILPNAKIIDVRRHPLDCGFSCFKTWFPKDQPVTYDLRDIGRAYADYVELMAHFDDLLKGRVHRVIYEHLVHDPEREIRRLLDCLGLPFEEGCLKFHENKRLVLTLSADQVTMPLYESGIGHWRRYEEWLAPLKEELGYVLDVYPEVPNFFPELHVRTKVLSWPATAGHPVEPA